jgi:hypothetical protein
MSIKSNTIKYRPVLTAKDILHILGLAKTEVPLTTASINVIQKLSVFQTKIENSAILPAYSSIRESKAERDTDLLNSLGCNLTNSTTMTLDSNLHDTKEQYWKASFIKYSQDKKACSLDELHAAQEHRYLNDLMTAEEESVHESNLANDDDTELDDRGDN